MMRSRTKWQLNIIVWSMLIFFVPISVKAIGLTVAGFRLSDEAQAAALSHFHQSYPEATVTFQWPVDTEAIATQLINRDHAVDIYYISTEYGLVNAIRDKGMYMDLRDVPFVSARYGAFYQTIQDLFSDGSGIYAYPMEMLLGQTFLWQPEIAGEMGLNEQDIPKTFFELMDMVDAWEADNLGMNEYGIFLGGGYTNPYALAALQFYKEISIRDTGAVVYDCDGFRALMARIAPYTRTVRYQTDEMSAAFEQMMPSYFAVNTIPSCSARTLLLYDMHRPIALSLDGASTPIVSCAFSCLIINPNTLYPEEAKALLNSIISVQDEVELMAMTPSIQRAIENPNFQKELAEIDSLLDSYKKQLENCEPEEVSWIERMIELTEENRSHFMDAYRYLVTEETLDFYRQDIVPNLFVTGNSLYENKQVDQMIIQLYDQYAQGVLSEESFIKKLDRSVRMLALENE